MRDSCRRNVCIESLRVFDRQRSPNNIFFRVLVFFPLSFFSNLACVIDRIVYVNYFILKVTLQFLSFVFMIVMYITCILHDDVHHSNKKFDLTLVCNIFQIVVCWYICTTWQIVNFFFFQFYPSSEPGEDSDSPLK